MEGVRRDRMFLETEGPYRNDVASEGRIFSMVLAGGRGERLIPLTGHRAKPAVPFGGRYRLIDFVLSNMVNSGLTRIVVLTQHQEDSLLHHVDKSWVRSNGDAIQLASAHEKGTTYVGTADAVYKNVDRIHEVRPDLVAVFGADHVYCMDVRAMIRWHWEKGADVTVAAIPMPVNTLRSQFGTMVVDRDWRITRFEEKVPNPTSIPGRPDQALVSMGNYIFNPQILEEELERDAMDDDSAHDFGRSILPRICRTRKVYAYDFRSNIIPGCEGPSDYWRDVGTIANYYRATMDLLNPLCHLRLDLSEWPIYSAGNERCPPRIISGGSGRGGCVENSVIGNGSVVSGGYVRNSVIGEHVRIDDGALVEESVFLGDAVVGEGARVRRAIIDHGNVVAAGDHVGWERDRDLSRFHVDPSGVVLVPHKAIQTPQKGGPLKKPLRWREMPDTESLGRLINSASNA